MSSLDFCGERLGGCSAPIIDLYALDVLSTIHGHITDKHTTTMVIVCSEHISGLNSSSFHTTMGAHIIGVQQIWSESCVCPTLIDEAPCGEPTYFHAVLQFDTEYIGSVDVMSSVQGASATSHAVIQHSSAPELITSENGTSTLPVTITDATSTDSHAAAYPNLYNMMVARWRQSVETIVVDGSVDNGFGSNPNS
ncbi:hypothetical protein CYMTET_27800 [Cymbomonas tetramitiformis]|uniref:Uncharacterized protein n=1 Tax=Cymbomonas tetramitiformis TaxID=36881 RepID=A0AAE0KWU3_9CHLO|nr:hypothetical protein CYMTET_27800 [Cymbomonas tetramitiformis]